jgi:Uncharacterised nucleotidyltransferase
MTLTDNERELILICARQTLPHQLIERGAEIVRHSLNWEETIATAWRHGVSSLLFQNVQLFGCDVNADARHLLRQSYVRASFRNRAHFDAMAELIERFHAAGIEIVLLKGAALASRLYRDPALRPFADIDLLVRENEIDRAKDILLASNYQVAPELLSESFNRKYHVNLPFVRRDERPVHVELHWKLSDPFSSVAFDYEALLARAQNVEVGGWKARALSLEDDFVYLATHLDKHGYANRAIVDLANASEFSLDELSGDRLIWFTDLHELISAGQLDWAIVIERARAAHASNALAVSLRLLRNLLGTDVPAHVLTELPLPEPNWMKQALNRYVLSLATQNNQDHRNSFRQRFVATRKGFELRLVRLVDVWDYIFPASRRSIGHSGRALWRCLGMLVELQWRRALRGLRPRPA